MKKTLLISSVLLLLSSCVQTHPAYNAHEQNKVPAEIARRGAYIALPGREIVKVRPTDTDAAFDQQVAAYQNSVAGQTTPVAPVTQPVIDDGYSAPQPGPVVITQPQQADMYPADDQAATGMITPTPTDPVAANPAVTGNMDYTIKVTNKTEGRIYVEAHDAAGVIYPCGFMWGGKSYSTTKEKSAPIRGPITVVVRDPDQPGAPELRRYKVDPPANYNHKTIGINIIPGGVYQATLDGQEYYISGTPAPPKPAPAPAAAPIPEPTAAQPEASPAGI